MRPLLLTGFEAYGGLPVNPSARLAERFDGSLLNGRAVFARVLPVTLDGLAARVERLLADTDPAAVVCLGLAPGTPTVRLERCAVNLADFDIPDNAGLICRERPLADGGPDALFATLPLGTILSALLAAGVPAQVSNSAGTFLCNAVSYTFLRALAGGGRRPCGFVHLPYLPEQVSERIAAERGQQCADQQYGLASMSLATQADAVRIILEQTAGVCTTHSPEEYS